MASWSQLPLLQALGWATLNSLWQIALLWIIFWFSCSFLRFSAAKKYYAAIGSLLLGFAFFLFTFFSYWTNGERYSAELFTTAYSYTIVQKLITAAAVCYLLLFFLPAYRLFKNWQFLLKLKKQSLQKAGLEYRLFVQKRASLLSIKKEVRLYVSEWVTSPVTVGYFKPIILLPVAALNHLSLQQTEAILLHELSHIRRSDYLINWILTVIHTLLYFNPFVKMFLRVAETERENCCDELVLQFQYDKVSYASALLTLEKNAVRTPVLGMAATGQKFLLRRIEKIVGLEKKVFRLRDFAGLLGAFVCILLLHSFLLTKKISSGKPENTYSYFTTPLLFSNGEENEPSPKVDRKSVQLWVKTATTNQWSLVKKTAGDKATETPALQEISEKTDAVIPVRYDEAVKLSEEDKHRVTTALNTTKKALRTLQWQEVENNIADVMTKDEKAAVKQEYSKEVESIDWKTLESNLKSNYDKLDWEKINGTLSAWQKAIQLDSVQKSYTEILTQLKQLDNQVKLKEAACTVPFPDESVNEINKQKQEIKTQLQKVRIMRTKKIIHL